jgi:hypothetical protein
VASRTCAQRRRWKLIASGLAGLMLLGACGAWASAAASGDPQPAQRAAQWQLIRLPATIARTWILSSVSCPTSRLCMVVGARGDEAAAATLTGSVWHVLHPVERAGSGTHAVVASDFMSVSCPSTTDCVAVGISTPRPASDENLRPLAEHWNGVRWSLQAVAPLRPRAWAQSFPGVSCPSSATCMAAAKIGSGAAGTGADGAADIWHPGARRWRSTGLRRATYLLGVSCVSNVRCVAISADGMYIWQHNRWTRQLVPGLGARAPSAISCASATRCVVVAGSDPATSFVLRGQSWTRHAMPGHGGNDWTWFGGISCPTASSCIAVGSVSAHNQSETPALLAERWNGTSWQLEPVKPVAGGGGASLSAVSCPTPADCVAVGGKGLSQIPLVERRS